VGGRPLPRCGVVHQDVDGAELLRRSGDDLLPRALVGHVAHHRASGREIVGHAFRPVGVDVGDKDPCALAGEPAGGRLTNAGPGSGDDGHLAGKAFRC